MVTEKQILQRLITILESKPDVKTRYSSEIQRFRETQHTNDKGKYRLGVIGVTSSGKSTMINSLLGESLLPAVARPSSSQLVTCFKGERCATVFFDDMSQKTFSGKNLTPELIARYGDEFSNSQNKEHVKQIEIRTPNIPLDESLVIIDSPGLDAFGFEGHEQLTMHSLLPTVDFVLFITTCKTNSDEKMREVLNVIAEYNKPVIVIQNMIDSLRPSPDKKKSVVEVALDHKGRIERVIGASKIMDKSKVYIVQISAKWALEAREKELMGRKSPSNSREYEKSNFEFFLKSISSVFSMVKPNVEKNRLRLLKKEIEKICGDAEKDSKGQDLMLLEFEYSGKEESLRSDFSNRLESIKGGIEKLREAQNDIRNLDLSQATLDSIVKLRSEVESIIISIMRSYYQKLAKDCESLNVDIRNFTMNFQVADLSPLKVKTKTTSREVPDGYDKVKKDGLLNKAIRLGGKLFGNDEWGYKTVPKYKTIYEEKPDTKATIESAVNYLELAIGSITRVLSNWEQTIKNINTSLCKVIDQKEEEFENRKKLALKAEVYRDLAKELRQLLAEIKLEDIKNEVVHTDDNIGVRESFSDIEASAVTYNVVRLAQRYSNIMHKAIVEKVSLKNAENIIVGWDKFSEAEILSRNFNILTDYNSIKEGINEFKGVTVVHNPTRFTLQKARSGRSANVYVLINAVQFGSALKQVAACELGSIFSRTDKVFTVIQDFNETVNAQAVEETLSNMLTIGKETGLCIPYSVLVNHENPVFNMVAAEAQLNPCKLQSDEISLLNDVQKNFGYLLLGKADISIILQNLIKILSNR